MQFEMTNLYEQVFACWLEGKRIPFILVDQSKRPEFNQESVKNFDFLLRGQSDNPVLVELKGRTFHGTRLAGLKGLDGWVTLEDVEALSCWQSCFQSQKPNATAVFVFVFRFEHIDVETDGHAVYDFGDEKYLMLAVPLEKYRKRMKPRSRKWRTVTISADDFRQWAKPVDVIIINHRER